MLVSCKITNTVIAFLEEKEIDPSFLVETCSLPEEYLRDPSYWIEAPLAEKFLQNFLLLSDDFQRPDIFLSVVKEGLANRSWGIFDSVLRMMPAPEELFSEPQRVFAYFISPKPPVANLQKHGDGVSFDLPVPSFQYPLITAFLAACLEKIPTLAGRLPAPCTWNDIHVKLKFAEYSQAEFSTAELGHNVSPELIRHVLDSLEKQQRSLEERNRDFTVLVNNISKLTDYMVRAQQLVTLLIGQDRLNKGIQQVMKKVDWAIVQKQFPETAEECRIILEKTKSQIVQNQKELPTLQKQLPPTQGQPTQGQ